MPVPDLSKEELQSLVTRFSHDVASPLTGVLALSEVLIQEARVGDRAADDLKRIHAAAEEIALMVRALGEAVTPSGTIRRTRGNTDPSRE